MRWGYSRKLIAVKSNCFEIVLVCVCACNSVDKCFLLKMILSIRMIVFWALNKILMNMLNILSELHFVCIAFPCRSSLLFFLLLCVSVFVSVLSPVCCVCLCLTFYGNLKVLVPRFLPGAAGVEFLSISVLRGCVSINYMLTITIKVGFFDIFLILYLHFLRVYKFRR